MILWLIWTITSQILEMKNLMQINIQSMDVNVNKQPVHLDYTYTYSSVELKCLRDRVYHDNHYRILPAHTCKEIIDFKIYKRRRQGHRAGVKRRKQQNPRYADLSNLSNIIMSNKSDPNYSEERIAMVNI